MGYVGGGVVVDNVTIEKNTSGQLQIKDDGVNTLKISDNTQASWNEEPDDYIHQSLTLDGGSPPNSAQVRGISR